MLKWALRALVLAYAVAAVTLNFKSVLAERHVAQTQIWSAVDPLQAFGAIKAAYETMPLDARIRMQFIMSLEQLRLREKTKIEPIAADLIYNIAKTASPMHQAVMSSRAMYLLNSGRWRESGEIKVLVDAMRSKAKLYPETWMISAYYHGMSGNPAIAAQSLVKGLQVGGRIESFRRLAKVINMEIEEK